MAVSINPPANELYPMFTETFAQNGATALHQNFVSDDFYILLTTEEAERFCRIERTTMWRDPTFPKAIRVAKGKNCYRLSDLKAWIDSKPTQR